MAVKFPRFTDFSVIGLWSPYFCGLTSAVSQRRRYSRVFINQTDVYFTYNLSVR